MATVQYPTKDSVKYFDNNTVYLRADNTTINQYLSEIESGATLDSFEPEQQRFSNDGALMYGYYGPITTVVDATGGTITTNQWTYQFGYSMVVKSLIYH